MLRTRLRAAKNRHQQTQRMFNVEKVQSQKIGEWFSTRLGLLFSESIISNSVNDIIGFRKGLKNRWQNVDLSAAMEIDHAAYHPTIQVDSYTTGWDRYREFKKEVTQVI